MFKRKLNIYEIIFFLIITVFTPYIKAISEVINNNDSNYLSWKREVRNSVQSGKLVLLTFLTMEEGIELANSVDNEFYADWSYYLNDFGFKNSDNLIIISTNRSYGKAIDENIDFDEYTLIFLRKKMPAILAQKSLTEAFYVLDYYYNNNWEKLVTYINQFLDENKKVTVDEFLNNQEKSLKDFNLKIIDIQMLNTEIESVNDTGIGFP
ncbi:hypothetical protein QA601_15960 [Chitinispirillales bacterium ANBcel5]|uniref:hypothetical protein n=1 Tax=Cellulosispirillum alkaliphilum TaxID=3039283 RepID=UPI002A5336FD|nr:hypothetical protein [Chitinispirillales bacterium ANBcel5]